ncbi:MAG: exosortase/archaeosortase family protein [Phycisphaerae bacterium]|nr:exosortase/archaeosortase family protein [Planctomycetota bacterium]MBL7220302.1 exosortase/archaeosortase family protein [Phycisphaerae bacterium]
MVGVFENRPVDQAFSRSVYVKVAVIAFLFCGLNFWQFEKLVAGWRIDPNWSHGFLIPLFSLYLIYTRWDQLVAARRRVCLWGLPIILLSLLVLVFAFFRLGTYWFCQLSMIPLLLGIVLYLSGPSVLKITWVPIVFLLLAIPIPDILYQKIAYPLQELAAHSTTVLLRLCNVTIDVNASSLSITSISGRVHPLQVVEACSGVRSLMAFVALSVAMAYIDDRPVWQRLVLIFSSLPITMLCNILRVTATATMFVIDKPELGQDFMHTFMGMALLPPALLMLLGLSWMMNHLFIESDDEDDEDVEAPVSSGTDNPPGVKA